jgi:LemA protein
MGPEATAKASGEMTGLLGRLLAIAENYPNLKADTTFVRLQDELAGTENRIGVARTRYNTAVKSFNAAIRKFPGSLFAAGLDLTAAEYFEPPAGSAAVQTPPSVSFE